MKQGGPKVGVNGGVDGGAKGVLFLLGCAAFILYAVIIAVRYAAGYPELADAPEFMGFVAVMALSKLAFLAILGLSAYGLGGAVFSRFLPGFGSLLEEWLFKTALGLLVISYAMFALGLAGLVYTMSGYIVLLAGVTVGSRQLMDFVKRASAVRLNVGITLPALILAGVSAYFLVGGLYGALLPPSGFDVLMYHMGVPRMYVDAHGIFPTPDINGSYFPFGVEMLYMLGILVDDAVSANLVNYAFAITGGLAAVAFARRFLGGVSGFTAFAIYACIPLVAWMLPQAYIEFALAAYTMLMLIALFAWFREGDSGWFVVAAVLAGFTMAVKYTGIVTVATVLAGIAAYQVFALKAGARKALLRAGLFLAICLAVSFPWYLKNWVYYSNPVHPFLPKLFGVDMPLMPGARTGVAGGGLGDLVTQVATSFWRTTFESGAYMVGWNNGFGPYFLMLIPGIALFRGVERELKYLMAFCLANYVLLLAPYLNLRYVFPIFVPLAILSAYPVGRLLKDGRPAAKAAGTALTALLALSAVEANTPAVSIREFPSASAEATDRYYSEGSFSGYLASYRMWKWINANLPGDAVIFQLWDDASVYFRHRKALGSTLAWGETGRQRIHRIAEPNHFAEFLPGQEIIENLRQMGAGYFLVNVNREGHALPRDPYFTAHTRLLMEDRGVFLFQVFP